MKSRSTLAVVIGTCFVLGWAFLVAGGPQPAPDEPPVSDLQAQLEAVQTIYRIRRFHHDNPPPTRAREIWEELAVPETMRVWSLRLKDARKLKTSVKTKTRDSHLFLAV